MNRESIADSLRELADQIESGKVEVGGDVSVSQFVYSEPFSIYPFGPVTDLVYLGKSIIIHHNANDEMLFDKLSGSLAGWSGGSGV